MVLRKKVEKKQENILLILSELRLFVKIFHKKGHKIFGA